MAIYTYEHPGDEKHSRFSGLVLKNEPDGIALVWDQNAELPMILTLTSIGEYAKVDAGKEVIVKYGGYLLRKYLSDLTDQMKTAAGLVSTTELTGVTPDVGLSAHVVRGVKYVGLSGKIVAKCDAHYNDPTNPRPMKKYAIAKTDRQGMVRASNGKEYMRHLDVEWIWEKNLVVIEEKKIPSTHEECVKMAGEKVKIEISAILKSISTTPKTIEPEPEWKMAFGGVKPPLPSIPEKWLSKELEELEAPF